MPPVTLYTTPLCGFCLATKRLLDRKGIAFTEIDVSGNPAARAAMAQRAMGRGTVPQIFVGDAHVGGFAEISALDRDGRLDRLLAG